MYSTSSVIGYQEPFVIKETMKEMKAGYTNMGELSWVTVVDAEGQCLV